jgi:hypothetical protein
VNITDLDRSLRLGTQAMIWPHKQGNSKLLVLGLATIISIWHCSGASANFFSDDARLTLPATGDMHFDRVVSLTLCKGADLKVLDPSVNFPRLRDVQLEADDANVLYLKQLAANYPRMKGISITQREPIDDDFLSTLAKFTELQAVSFECPVNTPSLLSNISPKSLKSMGFGRGNNLTDRPLGTSIELPSIRMLVIGGLALHPSFFGTFKFPNLGELDLQNAALTKGSLNGLAILPKLKVVHVYISRTLVDYSSTYAEELSSLRKHGIKVRLRIGG